ncbi:alpha/beta hydrolase [Edaphobacter aggregans]|uniref:alpha/beta hydrolase n=1 Tax=Edaphobacter aggregans TaxID=570835 RepID=UPI00068C7199|nr:alpha/beta fold hydrolase [Edaphobacter aggregans]
MARSKPKPAQPSRDTENIKVSWLVKALGAVMLGALLCSYLSLCLLYHQGQWQIVLHPTHTASQPPQSASLVRFGPGESAQPQLLGEWHPASPGSRYSGLTILFLPAGDGSLSDSTSMLEALHGIGLNVFAFDYRGYGRSADIHPSQQRMTEDAEAAWRYLTTTRDVPNHQIIPYGTGVGASLAANLAAEHPEIPALILDSPHADLLDEARRDSRSSLLPVGLLFHERFSLAAPLASLHTPKLLLTDSSAPRPEAFARAAEPKITVTLTSRSGALLDETITRFLDQYLPEPSRQLVPSPAPSATNPR